MPVAVTLLDEAFTADLALKGSVLHVNHDVVLHIAESECSLVALATNQNLILSASLQVDKHALIVLRLYVGVQVLIGLFNVFICGRNSFVLLLVIIGLFWLTFVVLMCDYMSLVVVFILNVACFFLFSI